MKFIKKITAVILAFIVCFMYGFPGDSIKSYAAEDINISDSWTNPVYDYQPPVKKSRGLFAASPDGAYNEDIEDIDDGIVKCREGLAERSSSIELNLTEPVEKELDLAAIARNIFLSSMDHTGVPVEGDYIRLHLASIKWNVYDGGIKDGNRTYIFMYYPLYYTTAQQEEEADELAEEVLDSINFKGKSDYQKVKAIYEYICSTMEYDEIPEHQGEGEDYYFLKHTAYAALKDHTAVCQGFATLMYRLCLEEGIDTRCIVSDTHGWNICKYKDKYYSCDSTWDLGNTDYRYFMRGSNYFPGDGDHLPSPDYTSASFRQLYPLDENNPEDCTDHDYALKDDKFECCYGCGAELGTAYYGKYPQTQVVKMEDDAVSDDYVIDEEVYEALSKAEWVNDRTNYDGQDFARLTADDKTLYFRYDPVRWIVSDDNDGELELESELVLDTGTKEQVQEILSGLNGFSAVSSVQKKKAGPSAYAKAKGITVSENGCSVYWLDGYEEYMDESGQRVSSSSFTGSAGMRLKVAAAAADVPCTSEHSFELKRTIDPDCEKCGYNVYECSRCGYTKYSQIPALGHDTEVIPAVEATYTKTGLTAGERCTVCGKVTKEQKAVAKKVLPAPSAAPVLTNCKDGIKIAWKKVAGASGYYIYRSKSGGSYAKIKTVTSGSTIGYIDTKATSNGYCYSYKVKAYVKEDSKTASGSYSSIRKTYRLSRPSITSAYNSAKGAITVKWGKNTKASGYQVKYVSGTAVKTVYAKSKDTAYKKITKLKKGKTYRIYVRSYRTVSGKKYYSAYSLVKSVKVRK